jgi:hypothetical protein
MGVAAVMVVVMAAAAGTGNCASVRTKYEERTCEKI